jgi:transcription antitermination factor NusG
MFYAVFIMSNKTMSDIFPIGQRIFFHSGNFIGHHGTVKKVENESKDPIAIFGFLIHVELDNGKMVFVEKSEHVSKIA